MCRCGAQGPRFNGELGSAGLTIGLDHLKDLFQPSPFYGLQDKQHPQHATVRS